MSDTTAQPWITEGSTQPPAHDPRARQSCADADRAADEQIRDLLAERVALTARLAKVEALAVRWEELSRETCPGCDSCDGNLYFALEGHARALRAALASDPTHAQDGGA